MCHISILKIDRLFFFNDWLVYFFFNQSSCNRLVYQTLIFPFISSLHFDICPASQRLYKIQFILYLSIISNLKYQQSVYIGPYLCWKETLRITLNNSPKVLHWNYILVLYWDILVYCHISCYNFYCGRIKSNTDNNSKVKHSVYHCTSPGHFKVNVAVYVPSPWSSTSPSDIDDHVCPLWSLVTIRARK